MCKKLIYLVSFVVVLGLILTSAAVGADPSLVGWWKLDETSGTIAKDSSGNGRDGTLQGNPQWVPGKINGALQFDGNDHVDTGYTEDLVNWTIACWVTSPAAPSSASPSGPVHREQNYQFNWNHSDANYRGAAALNVGGTWYPASYMPLEANTWYHLAATYDGSALKAYRNGMLITTNTAPEGNPSSENDSLKLGRHAQAVQYFTGTVDDARVYNRALTQEEIQQVMKGVPPGIAADPSPADKATDVPQDVVVNWTQGEFADKHDVYFGTNFNDVNNASRAIPLGVLASFGQTASTYDPVGLLDFSQTYYWRVDEVNAPPDFTIFKGDVWQFTVEPFAYPIAGTSITATASSQFNASTKPENTINGSGLDASDLHSTADVAVWLSSMTGPQPTWIQYEFDKVYKLHQMWVWNYNTSIDPVVGFGIKDATIEYSTNGTDWAVLTGVPQFARAPGTTGYAHNTTIDLTDVVAKYVKITAISNWGGILPQYGLGEVRFFYVPVVAREPNPASGAKDVPIGAIGALADVTLSFRAGREAAKHNVYLSDNSQAVIDGTAPVTTVTQARYGPLSPDLGKVYYWRVDEVNEAETPTTWRGDVWDFTTQQYFVVDDFEDYNDFQPDRIFDTWIDGWGVPANGSQVGYAMPPFAERAIVHSGKQSMPFDYNNTAGVAYSEAERTFASSQDWTVRGAKTLTLWFKGNPVAFLESPPGTFTMGADGVDIWGTADEFRFAYKQLSGDGSITATVKSILWVPGSSDWSKGGVMMRETLDAGAKNAFVAITTGAGNGATFQWRPTAGGSSSSSRTLTGISPPAAVKLVRQGNVFTGYVFLNGQWQQEGTPATIAMGSAVYIGLALTSHSTGVMTEAVFSDVTTTGTVTGAWQVAEIGGTHPANTAAPLYVALADSANKTATVKHPDSAATNIATWTEWNIDLTQLTGVNPRAIKKMIIGVGDKVNPQTAAGKMYFDDIRLYPQR